MPDETLFKYSYTRGLALFVYGLLVLGAVTIGLLRIGRWFETGGILPNLAAAVLVVALIGSVGGVAAMLNRLGQHMAFKQNFPNQRLRLYVAQPFAGLGLGVLVFTVLVIPVNLLLNFTASGQLVFADSFTSATFLAVSLLLAWIAGFYQEQGIKKIISLVKKTESPEPAELSTNADAPFSFKEWYHRRRQMARWSYTWGIFILLYGVAWMMGLVAVQLMWGLPMFSPQATNTAGIITVLVLGAWPTVMAGGVGGVIGMTNDLYRHVSFEQNFDRQFLMYFLVQPVVGAILGLAMYLFVSGGYLSLAPLFSNGTPPTIVDIPSIIMMQMVLGWAAGFRQQTISALVLKLIGDVMKFLKKVWTLINPVNLFNPAKRNAALADIGETTDVFKPLDEDDGPSDSFKWWAPD